MRKYEAEITFVGLVLLTVNRTEIKYKSKKDEEFSDSSSFYCTLRTL